MFISVVEHSHPCFGMTFHRINVPLVLTAALAGWWFAFTLNFDETRLEHVFPIGISMYVGIELIRLVTTLLELVGLSVLEHQWLSLNTYFSTLPVLTAGICALTVWAIQVVTDAVLSCLSGGNRFIDKKVAAIQFSGHSEGYRDDPGCSESETKLDSNTFS